MNFPLDGMPHHRRVNPSIKFCSAHLYTWVERARAQTLTTQSVGEQSSMSPPYLQMVAQVSWRSLKANTCHISLGYHLSLYHSDFVTIHFKLTWSVCDFLPSVGTALTWLVIDINMLIPYRYNQKSDMWAMGCVLYEMLTLRKVFDATVSKVFL